MTTTMKMLLAALALVATIGGARVATAGKKQTYNVGIDVAGRHAWGAMGDARRSADASQNITISIFAMDGYTAAFVAFTNANNVTVSCSTTTPAIVAALQGAQSDSHLDVKWDEAGQCKSAWVYTSSSRSVKEQ